MGGIKTYARAGACCYVVAIITVMAVTGQASQIIIRADRKRELRKAQRNEVNTNE